MRTTVLNRIERGYTESETQIVQMYVDATDVTSIKTCKLFIVFDAIQGLRVCVGCSWSNIFR